MNTALRVGERTLTRRAPPLYTRTGDKGTTSLLNAERRPKDAPVFEALGALDDLGAHLGHARALLVAQGEPTLPPRLEEVQMRLLDIGSHLAAPPNSERTSAELRDKVRVRPEHTAVVEGWIGRRPAGLGKNGGLFFSSLVWVGVLADSKI
jgi:cob(I)alamin adenosyltransferase